MNTLFSIKMLVISVGTDKMVDIRIANSEDADQTSVLPGSELFRPFLQATSVCYFRTSTIS